MSETIGPRMYLVGQIFAAMLTTPLDMDRDEMAIEAVRLADLTLNAMGWSDGRPQRPDGELPPRLMGQ